MMLNRYTSDEDAFIVANADKFGYASMAREMSAKFGIPRTHSSVLARCKVLNVTLLNPNYNRYTQKHIDFIKSKANSEITMPQLTKLFVNEFNLNVSPEAMMHICSKNNIFSERKGLKMVAGERNPFSKRCSIGSECASGGKIYVKVAENVITSGNSRLNENGNWREKKRYMYEKYNGSIPSGYHIIHLDGNKQNFEQNNLYAIPPKINMVMGAKKWFSQDKDITLTGIKWCELFYATKNAMKA